MWKKRESKNGFMKGKQRYKCKFYGSNYIVVVRIGYSEHIKQKSIKYYLDSNSFRRIERLMGVSHVSVINLRKTGITKFR